MFLQIKRVGVTDWSLDEERRERSAYLKGKVRAIDEAKEAAAACSRPREGCQRGLRDKITAMSLDVFGCFGGRVAATGPKTRPRGTLRRRPGNISGGEPRASAA